MKTFWLHFVLAFIVAFTSRAFAYLDPTYDFAQLNSEESAWVKNKFYAESSRVWYSSGVEGHWGNPYLACVASNAQGFPGEQVQGHGMTNTVTNESTISGTHWHTLMEAMNLDTQMRCEAQINGVWRPGYTIWLDDHPAPCQVLSESEPLIVPVVGWVEGDLVTFADVVSENDDTPDGRWDLPMYSTMSYYTDPQGIQRAEMRVFKSELDGASNGDIQEIRYQLRPIFWTQNQETDAVRGCARWE